MKRALIVGIDDYPADPLSGCVNDATTMHQLLARNGDDSVNFHCVLRTAPGDVLSRPAFRGLLHELFAHKTDIALLYFAGHGARTERGGILVTQDGQEHDEGIGLEEILTLANKATGIGEVVLILDACFAGHIGEVAGPGTVLREGVSILAACRGTQTASEDNGAGSFTSLVAEALSGGGMDVLGDVSVASVYAYVDQVFSAWQQRPVFKANVARLTPLRRCTPPISQAVLRKLPEYFVLPEFELPLDPSYEPTAQPRHAENEAMFGHLQACRAVRLVEPVGTAHMYDAAMGRLACRLTPLGRFYWMLASRNLL
jgi:hypothetical protein